MYTLTSLILSSKSIPASNWEVSVNLSPLSRLLGPKLPRWSHLVGTGRSWEVQQTRSFPPNFGSNPPNLAKWKLQILKTKRDTNGIANLILVKVEEVKTAIMLVDGMLIVVTPEMEGSHLVSLVYSAWTPAVHCQGTAIARVLGSGVASCVRVALETWTTFASRLTTQNATGCPKTTFHNRTWVGRTCNLQKRWYLSCEN